MSSVASKNLYDLVGNDPDQDPELRTEPAPTATVEKPAARTGKRNTPTDAPVDSVAPTAGRGRGRGGRGRGARGGGSEQAFQDQDAGRNRNREKPTDDGLREDRHSNQLRGGRIQRGPGYDGRGGRGGAGGRASRGGRDDRHSRSVHSGPNDQAKQAGHGWGEDTAQGEWNDEKAADADAWEESKKGYDALPGEPVDAEGNAPVTSEENTLPAEEPTAEAEPEDKSKSYSDYLAEQAEKKLQLGSTLQARKANEGVGKTPAGHAIEKDENDYFAGSGPKAGRQRERKEKNLYQIEHDIQARDQGYTGGRRGGRGGRGRGEGGLRGEGRGRARGEFRGGRGRGSYGGPAPNVSNTTDFPTLGN